jgi:hypothetical protein
LHCPVLCTDVGGSGAAQRSASHRETDPCLPFQKGVTGASEAMTEVSRYRCKSTICHVRRTGDCLVGRRTLSHFQFFLFYLLQFDRATPPLLRAGIAQGK